MQLLLWVDIIFMVRALKGDDVIEVKKKRFNILEHKLLIVMRAIMALFFLIKATEIVYLLYNCSN
jgi:hypothetical protein